MEVSIGGRKVFAQYVVIGIDERRPKNKIELISAGGRTRWVSVPFLRDYFKDKPTPVRGRALEL